MANTYRFKTVMTSDRDRAHFTRLRNRASKAAGHRVTDKELFALLLDNANGDAIVASLVARKAEMLAARELEKLHKAEAKLAAKLAALQPTENSETEQPAEEAAA